MSRNFDFEKFCKKKKIPVYFHCECGTVFCQHDQSTLDYYAKYTGETAEAYKAWMKAKVAVTR